MFKRQRRFLVILIFLTLIPFSAAAEIQDSIVKVFTTSSPYDYDTPWQISGIESSTGSGSIISGNRILTNAHVVSNAAYIEVQRNGVPEKYQAALIAVSHEADLALLHVEDDTFFHGAEPLEIGALPELLDEVVVYGYPEGGEGLSVTKGIVSRIELTQYVHSLLYFLGLQIDAAINGGNSGGPVVKDGRIIGVAMQTKTDAENIGYIVPPPIINHFLTDIDDGQYDGFPTDGVYTQDIENPVFREALQIPDEQTGIYVNEVIPGASADKIIFPGDVLLSVDGHDVANDGSIELRPGLRVSCDFLVTKHQMHDTLQVDVWRDAKRQSLSMPLTSDVGTIDLVKRYEFDTQPQYYILSGLIFTPLTFNYFQTWGDDWLKEVPISLLKHFFANRSKSNEDIVVMNGILPASDNAGYRDLVDTRMVAVNGQEFSCFKDFADLLDEALDTDETIRLTTEGNGTIVISSEVHKTLLPELLERYGIEQEKHINK